ncbi:hypothetical protein EZV62_012277 [Acer yangbiense]|uniref:CCHC-type domain-containing protein n=1 Tax=Acer yangbiense TaxID=1000413 RepID=A0A5C7HVT5_9ROSI|nr:hypothetical protein EZV62_012277 [Acer yangbiense]
MCDTEISRLYENLSITDEDGAVLETSEDVQLDGVEDVEKCLVGKVLSGKKVNRKAFKGLIEQIWNPFGTVEVEMVGDNIFMFYFINRVDRNKRWLRLKLGKTKKVTVVNLKYERLPEFCFVCGKIGHGSKECQDKEARNASLDGLPNRFGSWLKAPIPDRTKPRDTEGDGSVSVKNGSLATQKEAPVNNVVTAQEALKKKLVETLPPVKNLQNVPPNNMRAKELPIPNPPKPKPSSKKWKRLAREGAVKQTVGLTYSPFQRMLGVSLSPRRSPKCNSSSPIAAIRGKSSKKGRSPQKFLPAALNFPNKQCDVSTYRIVVEGQACKRKVVFDMESAVHAFFGCKEVRKIWQETQFGCWIASRNFPSVLEGFIGLATHFGTNCLS